MNTLILLLPAESAWSPETWASRHGGERRDGDQIIIEVPSGWLSVMRDDRVLNDYDTGERAALTTMLSEPVPFLIEWKSDDLLQKLLRDVPIDTGAVVDNDHGILTPVRNVRGLTVESWVRAKKLP